MKFAFLAFAAGVCRGVVAVAYLAFSVYVLSTHTAFAAPPAEKAATDKVAADKNSDKLALNGTKARTRFVIGLEQKSDFQVSSLQNPNRVVVDLPDVKVHLPTISGDQPVGLVKSFRGGLASAGKMRVIIDVTDPVIVESAKFEAAKDGQMGRLVLEIVLADGAKPVPKKVLASVDGQSNVGLATVQPPLPRPAQRPEARAAKSFKPVIVLDPGHGGHDSGANRNGAMEKEVVLAFALALRDRLNSTGRYKVLMTRENDTFVPLDDRRAFGETNKAALFIAIHADYAGAQARGATIYSLRESVANDLKRSATGGQSALSDRELKTLPAVENSDQGAIKGMLSDLADTEVQVNKQRTSVFARSVIEYMGASTPMMSNPDRSAAFRVLKTATVPAVLIELAYVSNKEDAARLKSNEWRTKVSTSIVTAVENYFANQIARCSQC